jgi:arylsulfatase A-like enzyme/tetratricopeptide (TPR) repeat protein
VAGAAVALILVALTAWWLRPATSTAPRAGAQINLLLVTIDTLRADHVGCYGDADAQTPVLDGLAARGVRFETAVAHAPITGPSHASILTGLTPLKHGVRNNGGFVLPKDVPTLAEALTRAGYQTAAFVSGFPLDRRFGYGRGFGVYDDRFPHGSDPRRAPYVERPADQTTDVALQWLDRRPSSASPWFMWIHYYDPHSPYEPPAEYGKRFATHPYDGEIAFVDAQLGVLLRRLETVGLANRTLVIVTSDHGESLGEHGEATHGIFLYDATLKVPWIMVGPGVPAGRVSQVVGRLIDVAPTLLDYAGQAIPIGIEGRSVRPAVEGRAMADEPAYAESLFANLHLHWSPLHAWRTARWKLIDAPRPELFDLERDGVELHDLSDSEGARVADMRRPLRAALRTKTPDATSSVGADAAERLRALGYIGGGAPSSVEEGATLRDPKDALPLLKKLERGMELARIDPATAAQELSAVLQDAPDAALPRRYRAVALAAAGHHQEAIADMRILEKAGALTTEDLIVLGDSLRLAGRTAEALEALDKASALQPQSPLPWLTRANTLLASGRHDEAAQAYDRALAIVPEHSEALRGLGDLALIRGDLTAASGFYGRVLAAAPKDAGALMKLGVVRMRAGQRDSAVALFTKAIDADPVNGEALLYMAGAMAATGRNADAVPYFERALATGMRTPMVLTGLGMTRLELGDEAGALVALRESLARDPKQQQVADLVARLDRRRR